MTDRELVVLDSFKTDSVEKILLVQEDNEIAKLILTWPSVVKEFRDNIEKCTDISEVWDLTYIDFRDWADRSGIKLTALKKKYYKMLISNNIVYPDGSISPAVKTFLIKRSVAIYNKIVGPPKEPVKPVEPVKEEEVENAE